MCASDSKGNATPRVLMDNDRTRLTEWRFAPGANTGWHRHEYDYVAAPMLDGTLEIALPGGERVKSGLETGVPYFRQEGVEHDVINTNGFEFAFIEIEFKS